MSKDLTTAIAQILGLIVIFGTPCIAKYKGRSFFLWFLYALVLNVIAFIHVLCVRKMKKCPMCMEDIDADAKICSHCGTIQ